LTTLNQENPKVSKLDRLFLPLWMLAHGISWAIFLPIFCNLIGFNILGSSSGIVPEVTPQEMVRVFLLIGFCEGFFETLVLIFYLPGWYFWLPASLGGALPGALLANLFIINPFIQIFIVMATVTLLQCAALSISCRGTYWWIVSKGLGGLLVFPTFLLTLMINGFILNNILGNLIKGDEGLWNIYNFYTVMVGFMLVGLLYGFFISFGIQKPLGKKKPTAYELTFKQRLRTWQAILISALLLLSAGVVVLVQLT
jgi:hypothetical protein